MGKEAHGSTAGGSRYNWAQTLRIKPPNRGTGGEVK